MGRREFVLSHHTTSSQMSLLHVFESLCRVDGAGDTLDVLYCEVLSFRSKDGPDLSRRFTHLICEYQLAHPALEPRCCLYNMRYSSSRSKLVARCSHSRPSLPCGDTATGDLAGVVVYSLRKTKAGD